MEPLPTKISKFVTIKVMKVVTVTMFQKNTPDSFEIDEEIIENCYNIVSNIKLEWNNDADKNVKRVIWISTEKV